MFVVVPVQYGLPHTGVCVALRGSFGMAEVSSGSAGYILNCTIGGAPIGCYNPHQSPAVSTAAV
ncbi:hypothetical protein U128_02755 [Anaplasma marginale str. Gypsy Plains]|nr:hypothetical protein U128_02755 [Anaplasma marginale str. Gypsy Plains]